MNRSCGERIFLRLADLHPDCIGLGVTLFGYIAPALALFVTATNVVIVIVFTRPHIRSHTTFILTLIACADILNIACPTVVFAYHYLFGYYKEFLTCRQIEWTYILGEICVDIFNMLSLWLTVLLAFIRSRCIKSPFVARHVHSFKRIMIYIICILILTLSVHVPSFFTFEFQPVQYMDPSGNVTRTLCAMLESDGIFLKSCSGRKVQLIMETVLDSILPCVLLVYYNFVMLVTLRKAKQSRSSLRRNDSVRVDHNIDGEHYAKGEYSKERKALNCKAVNLNSNGINCETVNMDCDKDDVFHETNGRNKSSNTKQGEDNKFDTVFLHAEEKNHEMERMKSSVFNLSHICICFSSKNPSAKRVHESISSDYSLDKLDRESRRTSWLIICVSTMVIVHELPLTVLNTYNLTTYTDGPLPLSSGCISIVLLLWQFVTFPTVFLIYACMSSAFRSELRKMLTCKREHTELRLSNKRKSFLSPCSVRRTIKRDKVTRARPSGDTASGSSNDCFDGNLSPHECLGD